MAYMALERKDLRSFDAEATKMILDAIAAGCTGRVSSKGHAILRNPAGSTVSISRDLRTPNRSAQNTRADYRRFMATLETPVNGTAPEVTAEVVSEPSEPSDDGKVPCPDCGEPVNVRGLGAHRAFAHKGVKPARRRTAPDPDLPGLEPVPDTMVRHFKGKGGYTATRYAVNTEGTEWWCRFPGCGRTITDQKSLGGHQRGHTAVLRKAEKAAAEEPTPKPDVVQNVTDTVAVVDAIRELLGKDPRVVELEHDVARLTTERDEAVKHAADLDAKLSLLRETLDA